MTTHYLTPRLSVSQVYSSDVWLAAAQAAGSAAYARETAAGQNSRPARAFAYRVAFAEAMPALNSPMLYCRRFCETKKVGAK